jgi:hypothetical protein
MRWLIADWGGNKGHIFESVIGSLANLKQPYEIIPRSDVARRQELLDAIRSRSFDILLTWQRFYGMQKDILAAIEESGIKTLYMDFGFLPHYESVVFDTSGENAASSWPKLWKLGGPNDLGEEDLDLAAEVMEGHAARACVMLKPQALDEDIRFPFLFVPLQRPGDSVVKYDSSVHNFGTLLRRVLLLAKGSRFVVCKTHPLDQALDLGVPDRICGSHILVRRSFGADNEQVCNYLLSRASLVGREQQHVVSRHPIRNACCGHRKGMVQRQRRYARS